MTLENHKFLHFLNKSIENEIDLNFSDSLFNLYEASKLKIDLSFDEIYKIHTKRICQKIKIESNKLLQNVKIKKIFESNKNPNNYAKSFSGNEFNLPPLISLTTISSRFNESILETLDSIIKQDCEFHSINLYISEDKFLLDEGISKDEPFLMEIANKGINIYSTINYGPYRKQIPILLQLSNSSAPPNTPIITIDDDVIYPNWIIKSFIENLESCESVICHRGREIKKDGNYLSQYKKFSVPKENKSFLNLATGKNGIAYKFKFFPKNKEDLFIGPIIAPTSDDIWCKWVTAQRGIPTLILEPNAAFKPKYDFKESTKSNDLSLFNSFNKLRSNDIAINNMESFFRMNYNFSLKEVFQ